MGYRVNLSGEYHEDCNKLMLEVVQLKAQIETLRFAVEYCATSTNRKMARDYHDKILSRIPAQSLVKVRADAVIHVINHINQAHSFTLSDYGQGLKQGFKDFHEQASAKAELIRQGEF